jgi:hypothetical protein
MEKENFTPKQILTLMIICKPIGLMDSLKDKPLVIHQRSNSSFKNENF